MKKIIIASCIAIACGASFILYKQMRPTQKAEFTIGILKTASHPALDAAQNGFTTRLKELLGDRIAFIEQNAQGSVDTMHAIAQRMHSKNDITAFYAIATPALQAIASTEKKRPIIFAAVTDLQVVGINQEPNICGASDMINISSTVAMIKQITPHAKTIALLYTNAEPNSALLAKKMKTELSANGLTVLEFPIGDQADIPTAADWAFLKADAVLAPTDNGVASAIDLIAALAVKHKKPLYVSDNLLVSHGALASWGIDYTANGKEAAQITFELLTQNKIPTDFGTVQPKETTIFLNQKIATTLGITIPESLKKSLTIINK